MTPEEIKKKRKALEKEKKENISPELAASMAKVNTPISTVVIGKSKPKSKPIKNKRKKKFNPVKSQSVRKAPRAARSANAKRWSDLRENDGVKYPVTTYKKGEEQ